MNKFIKWCILIYAVVLLIVGLIVELRNELKPWNGCIKCWWHNYPISSHEKGWHYHSDYNSNGSMSLDGHDFNYTPTKNL